MVDDLFQDETLPRPARPRKSAVLAIGLVLVAILAGGGWLLRSTFNGDTPRASARQELATPSADPPPAIAPLGDRSAYFAPPPPDVADEEPDPAPSIGEPQAVVRPAAWDSPITLIAAGADGQPGTGSRPASSGTPAMRTALPQGMPQGLPLPFAAARAGEGAPGADTGQLKAALDAMRIGAQTSLDADRPAFEPAGSASPAQSPFQGADTAALYGRKAGVVQASLASGRNTSRIRVPESRLTLSPGTIVHAVLTTAVNTDLPGAFNARVTRTVYDEIDGGIVLIPQGSLITGTVSTQVEYGEERAFLVAQYIRIAGTNHYLDLGGVSAAGLDGTAGIHADVNNHYGRALGVGILTALLGTSSAVARAGLDDDRDSIEAESIAGGATELQRVGGRFLERELRLRPTLTAKPGDQIAFILNRELQFDGGSP